MPIEPTFLSRFAGDPIALVTFSLPAILLIVILIAFYLLGKLQAKLEAQELHKASLLPSIDKDVVTPETKPADDVSSIKSDTEASWLKRLRGGLEKTRQRMTDSLSNIFSGTEKINEETLEKLHESLYRADIGVQTADKLVDAVRKNLKDKEGVEWTQVAACLKETTTDLMSSESKPLNKPNKGPWVILICGVNGVGKTTSIGKIAARFMAENKKVLLAAADTYRAAAIDQLKVWGERLDVDVIAHQQGSDPAAVAYDAVKAAISRDVDVLMIDTAGRLHSKNDLMEELRKINRVIGKDLPGAPHETWLVIDSTTGQNAVQQVRAFSDVVDVSGLIATKLDGTAKGGVLVGISQDHSFPIRYIGVGEKAPDLRDFSPKDFANSLF